MMIVYTTIIVMVDFFFFFDESVLYCVRKGIHKDVYFFIMLRDTNEKLDMLDMKDTDVCLVSIRRISGVYLEHIYKYWEILN